MDSSEATTLDGLLNRRVVLEQPANGYRVAVDTVLLAAAVPALAGDRVLDMGCGVGGASLCLACRLPGMKGTGIDIQAEMLDLFRRNIGRNEFATGIEVREADATALPDDMRGAFDHVMMNPPYHVEERHDVSPDLAKRRANAEKNGDLALWIKSAAGALKPSGTLTIIHRADRREDILEHLKAAFGAVEILPLLPKPWIDPKRIIVRARLDAAFAVHECSPIVLHKAEWGYTDEVEGVLRNVQALDFQSK